MELSARLSQQHLFSPQMQQGLQLLQAPMMELRGLVTAELATNPILEEIVQHPDPSSDENAFSRNNEKVMPWQESLQEAASGYREQEAERHRAFLESRPSFSTLTEVMRAQTVAFPKEEQQIVEAIIGNLDEWGYFRMSTKELAEALGISELKVEEVLKKVQQLDPPGVAARDLQECLLLQLERQKKGNSLASRIVRHYLPQLARHDYPSIGKALHLDLADILKAQKIITHLEPHPGRPYLAAEEGSVVADVIVIAEGEEFLVRLNEEGLTRVRLNDQYKELLAAESDNKELQTYLKQKIQSGRSFINHLEQRHATLLLVTNEIVRQQKDFFKYGAYGLHPLSMSQVASSLNLHPTTISRTVAGKTMETPRGFFSLKYFFTSGFEREDGKEISSETIKSLLQQLVAEEKKEDPLSDQEIVERFQEKGITVARRTIASYRDQLHILPKKMRKIYLS